MTQLAKPRLCIIAAPWSRCRSLLRTLTKLPAIQQACCCNLFSLVTAVSTSAPATLPRMSDGANRSAAPAEWTFSEDPNQKPRESCVKHFDALWFCYSPVFQMQQLYRYGEVDDCTRHWRQFYDCLKKRTKFADQVIESKPAEPLWQLRTPEEASSFWQEQFGSAAGGAQAAASKPHGRPGAQETGGSEKLTVA